jgi:glucosyl-3-phosphoglycerate synthase
MRNLENRVLKQFHHLDFKETDVLVRQKLQKGITISVVLPALNEAKTIGSIVSYIREHFTGNTPLVDEIIVIDGNSTDGTVRIANGAGAIVYNINEIVSEVQSKGKGVALWKSQFITKGDILLFIDSDILDFDKRFVSGLLGPLLANEEVLFTKAFYKRPLYIGSERYENYGGRVTEILVKPFLSALAPELAHVLQPLAGEYAIRRSAADQLPFWSGYGVEIGLLLDIFTTFGLQSIAQVDMEDRHHRNKSVLELSKMSFGILQVMLKKFEIMGVLTINTPLGQALQGSSSKDATVHTFDDFELPPKCELTERNFTDAIA